MHQNEEIINMMAIIKNCIETEKLEFLANLIVKLQKDYNDIATLSTDGEYDTTWSHRQVLDYLSYQPKRS